MRNKKLIACKGYDESILNISARETTRMIESGQSGWEDALEPSVAEMIKQQGLFGYR